MIRWIAGWLWVFHANVIDAYPGSTTLDLLLFKIAHAR